MIITPGFIGCDVSKAHLDIFDGGLGRPERIPNCAEAIAALCERWRSREVFALFEATGRYDAGLRLALDAAGIPYARVNPAHARAFARAKGRLAKTDAIDAESLAAMAMTLRPDPSPARSAVRDRLAALGGRRDQLVADRAREKARREALDEPAVADDIAAHLDFLDGRIKALEAAIAALVAAEAELAQDQALLRSIPGFGPIATTVMLSVMPELGRRDPKAIAALAGLAPINRDSGAFRGKRAIGGGRRRVRRALYMAALAAIKTRQRFADIYKAMIAKGKPPKVAIIAIARKLLVVANAVLRDQTPFKAEHA
ncbi:IS110 family transposase [Methylopila sp. M107]|uniref:IS110 family transposase n=1 Tax=Methylopila sp. M107 TaxID=1101190 RepID=UPI0003609C10|nr:IS110 family transposase [Methylopila sp. M107]